MAMQNVLDRLAKISKQQTRLSKNRKVNLSLADDLERYADSLADEINDSEDAIQESDNYLSNLMDTLSDLEDMLYDLEGRANSIESYKGDAIDLLSKYEDMAEELGVEPNDNPAYFSLNMDVDRITGAIAKLSMQMKLVEDVLKGLRSLR